MQLAEALLLAKELKKRAPRLKEQAKRANQVTEKLRLVDQCLNDYDELTRLLAAINRRNTESKVNTSEGEITITEALARREYLKDMIQLYQNTADRSYVNNNTTQRSKDQPRQTAVIKASTLHSDIAMYKRELRSLTMALQRADWTVSIGYYTPSEAVNDLTID